MPIALHSYQIDKDGEIRVRHTFFAKDDDEAEELMDTHADGCESFGPALNDGDTIEIYENIEELPDVAALELLAGPEDEEPEEDDEDEEEKEAEEG